MLNVAAAFLVLELGSSIFEMCTKIVGMIASPMAGVMVCAIVFPSLDLLVGHCYQYSTLSRFSKYDFKVVSLVISRNSNKRENNMSSSI